MNDPINEFQRLASNTSTSLCDVKKADLGQYYTRSETSLFMSSLFSEITSDVILLDAGAGSGILAATYVHKLTTQRRKPKSIHCHCFEIDDSVHNALRETLNLCGEICSEKNITFTYTISTDFVNYVCTQIAPDFFSTSECLPKFNRIIINPPYKKIRSDTDLYKKLRRISIQSNNLYSVFVSLCIRLLDSNGELVAITPRSFCNGPYFSSFRKDMFNRSALEHIHVFESRTAAFKEDKVLQENVIFKLRNAKQKQKVTVSSTPGREFSKVRKRKAPLNHIINEEDEAKIIHIIVSEDEIRVAKTFGKFSCPLNDLGLIVSTGPVVDFRHKKDLEKSLSQKTVPLFYAGHFDGTYVSYEKPLRSEKSTAIRVTEETEKWLISNARYVLTKRFSSKEERRRLVASIYEPDKQLGSIIGIENHLNYYHSKEGNISEDVAFGLYIYLNSTIVDDYFRLFSGHTQVNATDLRYLRYPNLSTLIKLGKRAKRNKLTQQFIDGLVEGVN